MSSSALDIHMPAEWHPHEACLIVYPHNTGVFRSEVSKCDLARAEVRNVARAICNEGNENVFLFCNTVGEADELKSTLEKESAPEGTKNNCNIYVEVCESDDSWCRDTGPTFVYTNDKKKMIGIDWDFNAYGGEKEGCYWPCNLDQAVAKNMVKTLSAQYADAETKIEHLEVKDLVLEGGSFHTDGEGTILVTEECLLNKNRNPHLSKAQIEEHLLTKLGAEKVVWLKDGLAFDDDTNGHIDNIACFARPGEIVLSWTDDEKDENYERFQAAMKVLQSTKDAKGRSFKVHKLYVPKPMVSQYSYNFHFVLSQLSYQVVHFITIQFYTEAEVKTLHEDEGAQACDRVVGERLAGSYVNYYLANDAVVLPQFGDEEFDKKAVETMQAVFPDKIIKGVFSKEILLGGGNIHCITQQMPKV